MNISVAADTNLRLYIDGAHVLYHMGWHSSSTVADISSCLLAVKAYNGGGNSGILLSTSGGDIISDATWKCSSEVEADWMTLCFDDSHWNEAVVSVANGNPPWGLFADIRADAMWMWSDKMIGYTYCRKRFC